MLSHERAPAVGVRSGPARAVQARSEKGTSMTQLDWTVIVAYFCLIGWVAWWYGRHQKDTKDYFLAGRNAGWIVIGASIFTSNIGSEHIVGLAGQGATTGMAMAHWELHAWVLIMLAGFFVPFYYRSGVETIPQFLEKRFNARTRWIDRARAHRQGARGGGVEQEGSRDRARHQPGHPLPQDHGVRARTPGPGTVVQEQGKPPDCLAFSEQIRTLSRCPETGR